MKYNALLIRLGEYMVRYGSGFRKRLVKRLGESISRVLVKHGLKGSVEVFDPRIIVRDIDDRINDYLEVLRIVPGISSISPAYMVEYDLGKIFNILEKIFAEKRSRSFRLIVEGDPGITRSLLARMISTVLVDKYGLQVNLVKPDTTIWLEFRKGYVFIVDEIVRGIGGLPYGVEGCLSILVSGGVDSVTATWFLVKRGIEPVIVYIDMEKYWSLMARKRFYEALRHIYRFTPWDSLEVFIVKGVGEIVAEADIPIRLRCLLCKSLMYTIASLIADEKKCLGIATGESVGQVASQTLRNLYLLSRIIDKPVYRPLLAMDKMEIIDHARRHGYIDLSRDVGGCSLKPAYPETSADEKDYMIIKKYVLSKMDLIKSFIDNARYIIVKDTFQSLDHF